MSIAQINKIENQIQKLTKEKNKLFHKMSKPEKRVAIAKDVIAQIKAGNYEVTNGKYLSSGGTIEEAINNQESCDCCALGACFLSKAKIFNKIQSVDMDAYEASGEIKEDLDDIFSDKQINMIECAFELGEQGTYETDFEDYKEDDNGFDGHSPTAQKCIKFGKRFKSSQSRLIAIMNNIIDNDGEFCP